MIKRTAIDKVKIKQVTAGLYSNLFYASKFIIGSLLTILVAIILQINLVIPIFLISLVVYLKFRKINVRNFRFLHLLFLFVLNFVISYFIITRGWPFSFIPFALVPMLITILFGELELSLLLVFATSVTISSIAKNNLYLGLLLFVNGIIASLLVLDVRKRVGVIRAGLIIGLIQAFTLLLIQRFWIGHPIRYLELFLNGIACSMIVLGVLPIFEYLFKTVTNISLLELADFNHPLLQRMTLEAPGTYHHSLIVGNLSDAACRAIGANSLLARIGAYYHDIGKLEKAEYFSENQDVSSSKHDSLSPDMSKLIIMNHVKEGVDLAGKYKLNPVIIDFILQHHGNSLVYYFYRRALENLGEDEVVKEEGFRYPGPKPNSKETAVVLLADSVEAATRALRDPTPAKIEEVVHKMINNRFIDGQLDECDLTLKDIEKISSVFIRMLTAVYHSRLNYPENIRSESNHKKSANQASHNGDKDKKNGS